MCGERKLQLEKPVPAANDGACNALEILLLCRVEARTHAGPEAEEAERTWDIIMVPRPAVIRRDDLEGEKISVNGRYSNITRTMYCDS